MSAPSLFDQLAEGFGAAVSDVREKLVEEAWFGRRLDDAKSVSPASETPADLGWQSEDQLSLPLSQPISWNSLTAGLEPSTESGPAQEPDIDLER